MTPTINPVNKTKDDTENEDEENASTMPVVRSTVRPAAAPPAHGAETVTRKKH